MPGQLDGKVVLITGANGGLGRHVTKAFLDAGATVAGVAPKISAADFPHEKFLAVPAQLSNGDSARTLVQSIVSKCERIDGLVHLVGGFAGGKSIGDTDDATFEQMIDMNLRSSFLMIRAVLPGMRSQGFGRILAIGSKAAVEPAPMAAVYAASKAALVSMVRSVASENKDQGITANIVLPGTMDTPANRAAMPKADPSQWVNPAQVAAMLVHLMSNEASQISGAVIPVYGAEA